jgi:hypothetical protein
VGFRILDVQALVLAGQFSVFLPIFFLSLYISRSPARQTAALGRLLCQNEPSKVVGHVPEKCCPGIWSILSQVNLNVEHRCWA